jgi:hypothetical protein
MTRKRIVFILSGTIAAALLTTATVTARLAAQGPQLTTKYFSSYARAHRLTISRNGTVVTTLDVPVGVWLSVYSDQEPVRTGQEGRIEFHGNVEIRTMPQAEVQRPGPGDAAQMMASAPLVVAAQNVDVLSETVIP